MIWYLTNVDTEVLALRTAIEALPPGFDRVRAGQPWALDGPLDLDGCRLVIVRLLRGRAAWPEGFDALRTDCLRRGIPFLAFPGDAAPDVELVRLSTVPTGLHAQAFAYLLNGGPRNFGHLLRFVADTVLLEGYGFEPPEEIAPHGIWRAPDATTEPDGRPLVGVIFYRAHLVAGNTQFAADLCDAIEAQGGRAIAVWCYSLRGAAAEPVLDLLRRAGVDALVTTVLATGGAAAGAGVVGAPGGLDGDDWDASRAGRPRRPGDPVALGRLVPGRLGGFRLRPGTLRRHRRGGRPRARRPDHRPHLRLQRGRRRRRRAGRRGAGLPDRPRPDGTRGRHRPAPRRPAPHTTRRPQGRPRAVGLPHQAQPARQRGGARHARLGHRAAARPGRRRLPRGGHPARRRHAHGPPGRRPHVRVRRADAGPAGAGRRRVRRRRLRRVDGHPARRRPRGARRDVGPGPRCAPDPRRAPAVQRARPRPRAGGHPAAPGLWRRPGRRVPLAQPGAGAPLPRLLPVARRGLGRRRDRPPRQARDPGVVAGQGVGAVGRLLARRGDRRRPVLLPVRGERPRRGQPGQAPDPRRDRRPPAPADDAGRHLRRAGPAGAAVRRVRPDPVARPGQAAGPAPADLGGHRRRQHRRRPRPRGVPR